MKWDIFSEENIEKHAWLFHCLVTQAELGPHGGIVEGVQRKDHKTKQHSHELRLKTLIMFI